MNDKIFIIAGGTGGHIIPALAIFNKLKERYKVYFICRRKDVGIVKQLEAIKENLIFFEARGLKRKFALDNFISIAYIFYGMIKSLVLLIWYNPSLILTFGGYISFSFLLNSLILRKRFIIFEQNSYPGVVNRLFGFFALKVFINFKFSEKFFKNSLCIGNPILERTTREVLEIESYKFFKFKKKLPVILVIGGSQGSVRINEVFSLIVNRLKDFNIIWITGERSYERFKKFGKLGKVLIYSYITDMGLVYRIVDVAVARAGAVTLTELAFWGIPAVLIPLQISAENHQLLNAKIIEAENGALVIEEKDLNEEILYDSIMKVLENREKMSKGIKKFYIKGGVKKGIEFIDSVMKGE